MKITGTLLLILTLCAELFAQDLQIKTPQIVKTIIIQKEFNISAPVDKILPLICPVKEYDWIEGWKCQLLHCPNGKNEVGVNFYEKMSNPFLLKSICGRTKWRTILFDTINFKVHFIWTNKYANALYKMELTPITNDSTRLVLNLAYTIKNKNGMKKYDDKFEYRLGFMIEGLGNMLKYYCENDKMLSTKNSERKKEFVSNLTLKEKVTFLLARLNMKFPTDRNKKKYRNGKLISINKV